MADSSNTTPKQPGGVTGKGFVKGDPRINRKGRPRPFDAFRALAQQIAHEEARSGNEPLVINGHIVTVAEALLRTLASSKNPRDRALFLEYAYGKPPAAVEVTGKDGGPVTIAVVNVDTDKL